MKLAKSDWQRAADSLKREGRPLDHALFRYVFEGAPAESVIDVLAGYQNEDGGFGHGLEPDFFLPASSPMATTVAFQTLTLLKVPSRHPVVRRGIDYFLRTYDKNKGKWEAVPPEVHTAPHAPWWRYDKEWGRNPGDDNWGNPTVEIAAYLHRHATLVTDDFLGEVTRRCEEHIRRVESLEPHEALCCLRLAGEVSSPLREAILDRITSDLPHLVQTDPARWDHYGLQPHHFCPDPASPLCGELGSLLADNLDHLIRNQNPDGSWSPTWQWGQFPEAWQEAKRRWKGWLTLDHLIKLKAFDRLDSR